MEQTKGKLSQKRLNSGKLGMQIIFDKNQYVSI